jgi:MFS transporter, FSR family, fosmidomycin resistance protein
VAGALSGVSTTSLASEERTAYRVLGAISFCHLLNDLNQSLLPAIYPLLKESFSLSFAQIGLITFTFQGVASILQPVVGLFTDRRPQPYSLAAGMALTFVGLLMLAYAPTFPLLLLAAATVGMGSAIFHPESSRVARMASGGQHGFAQSFFQVGGNLGSSVGPLVAAFVVLPRGRSSVAYFSAVALAGIVILIGIGRWASHHLAERARRAAGRETARVALPPQVVRRSIAVLIVLIFSKYIYMVSLSSYYTFYLIHRFGVSVRTAQLDLFIFLGAVALGTILGGPIGDRVGRKYVIWFSILGALPFTLMLPFAGLFWTVVLSVVIGATLASAFPAIVVYAQELMPGNVGMISGLFFGLAFGIAGIGAALLGMLADRTSIEFVYRICAFLPLLGLLTFLLPDIERPRRLA